MKLLIVATIIAASNLAIADNYVRPHVRSDGTYVEGHYRSNPNGSRYDNYSSQGNSNPYTGQQGSQRNEFSNQPAYNHGPKMETLPSLPDSTRRSRSGW